MDSMFDFLHSNTGVPEDVVGPSTPEEPATDDEEQCREFLLAMLRCLSGREVHCEEAAGNTLSEIPAQSTLRSLPGVVPLLGVYETQQDFHLVFEAAPFSLRTFITPFSPKPRPVSNDTEIRFVILHICSALREIHFRFGSHGNLRPENVLMYPNRGISVALSGFKPNLFQHGLREGSGVQYEEAESPVMRWCQGQHSNYDYLMHLNHLCGRRIEATLFPAFGFPFV